MDLLEEHGARSQFMQLHGCYTSTLAISQHWLSCTIRVAEPRNSEIPETAPAPDLRDAFIGSGFGSLRCIYRLRLRISEIQYSAWALDIRDPVVVSVFGFLRDPVVGFGFGSPRSCSRLRNLGIGSSPGS